MLSVRAPDHFGDGVMALAAIEALAQLGPLQIHAPRWGAALYEGHTVLPANAAPMGEIGVLFKPSFGAAWRWRHLRRRVGLASHQRGWLLTDPVPLREEHRREGYARIAAALGAPPAGPSRYRPRGQAAEVPDGFIGLNPWSPSPTVRWPYFAELARLLPRPVVFFSGPGEADAVRPIADGHLWLDNPSLPDMAATLERCGLFISNDSGASHFAAACGAPVLVLHGSTTAQRTGAGAAVEGPDLWCRPCYRKSCLRQLQCLTTIPAAQVAAEAQRWLR